MTTFEDGPAKDKILSLARAPVFLRVTEKDGKFDALDQVEDTPRPGEFMHVYKLVSYDGGAFVDGRDKKTGKRTGGYMVIARYKLYSEQPSQDTLGDTKKWQEWTLGDLKTRSGARK